MADAPPNSDDLISQFVNLVQVSPQVAREYLASSSWNLASAVTEYYNPASDPDEPGPPAPQPSSSNPPAPQANPTTSAMPPAKAPNKKFATLGDLRGAAGSSHAGHGHDEDENDEDYEPSDDENQNLYAGGEKSGLAVENPDDLKRKIIERAKRNLSRPGGDDPQAPTSRFTGTARTLGGDDTPSEIVPDTTSNPSRPRGAGPISRTLHFWADGFSVDSGPLFNASDPSNAAILAQIKQGRAPMSILNVEMGQEVDVKLEQHEGKYEKPKKKYVPFEGGGQRLGSPTPGVGTRVPEPSSAATQPAAASAPVGPTVDEAQPTVSLQIRLGDGTRLPARFNTTHTIGDVYSFVMASNAESRSRSWVLMTTFPSKELNDKGQALGDLAEFKRGGVVVQKWQ